MKLAGFISTLDRADPIDKFNKYVSQYDLIYCNNQTPIMLERAGVFMRYMQNKGSKVFLHVGSNFIRNGETEYAYITTNHQDWILKDELGNNICEKDYGADHLVIDFGDSTVRSWHIDRILNNYMNWVIEGIFFDMLPLYLYAEYYASVDNTAVTDLPVNSRSGIDYTNSEWNADGLALLQALRAQTDLKIIGNGFSFGTGKRFYSTMNPDHTAEPFIPYLDYVSIEGFVRWGGDALTTFRDETDWVYDINFLAYLGDKAISWCHLEASSAGILAQQDQQFNYIIGSYLLGCSMGAHLLYAGDMNSGFAKDYWPIINDYFTRLGTPTESFTDIAGAKARLSGGVNTYHRAFSNGIVLVNPTASNDAAVELGGTYYDLAGTSYASVAMNAHTGLVLLATAL